jgi:hypothetical protein
MKMMLSDFIVKLKIVSKEGNNPKTTEIVKMLDQYLIQQGDIEIDLDHMCNHFGIKI